jgi:hypothetical protein
VTKAEPFSYANLHSHLLTHEFLQKTSLQSIGVVVINAHLLPTPNQLHSALVSQRQPFGSFDKDRGCFHGGWCPIAGNNRGHRSVSRLIFAASVGLPTMIEGKEIDSKTGGIMAFQSGLMSGASYVNSSTT